MGMTGQPGPQLELQLIAGGLIAVSHDPRTLAVHLARVPPGAWASLWPGLGDEQVFYRCHGCGEPRALPIAVRIRRPA